MSSGTQVTHEIKDGRLIVRPGIDRFLYGRDRTEEMVRRLTDLFGYEVTIHDGNVTVWPNDLHEDGFSAKIIEQVVNAVELTFAEIYLTQPV